MPADYYLGGEIRYEQWKRVGRKEGSMASLMDNYEQQYAVLTADITAKIGKLAPLHGGT
jgi:hypothetical protein